VLRKRPEPPIPNAYWVTQRLAAGEHPGARDPDEARARLERFEAARIRVFVDLTHTSDGLEPYDGHLAPGRRRLRHPIVDMSVPTEAEMVAILDAIDAALADRKRVYVHCWGGIGRTGTVVGCWLVRHGSSPERAIATIRKRRRSIPAFGPHPDSPQTARQHELVRAWRRGR